MKKKSLVYVAHPYGNKAENKIKIDKIMEKLVFEDSNNIYVSPIHNYGFCYLDGDEYQKGLNICLGLLGKCDVLIVCGDWETSRGCLGEVKKAKEMKIPIFTLSEWWGKAISV